MTFKTEAEFEQAFIETLFNKGWESAVLKNPTEQDLINNWAKILFENNSGIDRLNGQPLTDSEMAQILEQIKKYEAYNEQEETDKRIMLKYLKDFDDVLTRQNEYGHFTSSAFILNKEIETKCL